jgi:hypothetical protein
VENVVGQKQENTRLKIPENGCNIPMESIMLFGPLSSEIGKYLEE